MIAKQNAEQGNVNGYNRRMQQAKCWTGWSIGLGVAGLIIFGVLMVRNDKKVQQLSALCQSAFLRRKKSEKNS